jgi:WD40 repeat protein
MHQRTGHEAVAPTLTYAADGKLLASGHVDGWARLWNPETGEMHEQALKHDGAVRALAFSPDGKVLASGSIDSSLRFWQVDAALNGQALRDLMRQPAAITALAYSPDGTHLVSSHSNRVLRAVDPRTRRLTATLRGPADLVSHLFFHGQDLFVVSRDKTLRVFDIGTRNEVRSLQLGRLANSVSVLDGGRVLAVVSQDHAVRLYDSRAGREIVALWGGSGESFASVTSFGRGRGLAVALADGRIRMWEVSV